MSARFKAFFIHLLCSLGLALCGLYWVFEVWYPAPLHIALGVTSIFILLISVDVIIGPLLTLLVYKPGKKTLVLDLSVIVVLQMGALTYGLWSVSQGRPAWIVFNTDRFDLVQVLDIDERGLANASPAYRAASWFGPQWVGARKPDDARQQQDLIFESLAGGSDLAQRPEFFVPLSALSEQMQQRVQPLQRLNEFNDNASVAHVLKKWPQAVAWVPMMARVEPMVVLLGENHKVLAVVALHPWAP